MGYIDLKIDITRGASWKSRNLRMRSLKKSKRRASNSGSSSSCNNTNDNEGQNMMVLDLYLASKTGNVDAIIDALERVSTQKNLPPSDLLNQVSPEGNTLLHLCIIHRNQEGAAFLAFHFPTLLPIPNSRGDTALHLAARADDRGIVEALIGICNEIRGFSPVSPSNYLNLSPSHEQLPIQPLAGGDWSDSLLRLKNKEGNTPLHESLMQGYFKNVASLLINNDCKVLHFLNEEGESPLYLASKAGHAGLVYEILINDQNESADGRLKGKSAIHVAILIRNQDVLRILLEHEPRFILLRDEGGKTPLHFATSLGYIEEVKYLLGINSGSIFVRDNNGLLPIHLASIKGYKSLVWLLLQYWPEPCELLSSKGQNILHVAVGNGTKDMVGYILETKKFKNLINMKDKDGNTPLHIAAMSWHPKIVDTLTWDKRVDLKLQNNQGKTALDSAEHYMENPPSFRMQLTWAALTSAGVSRASSNPHQETQNPMQSGKSDMGSYKDRVNTLLLVATLVATVTFAAGFTVPGGYNNSDPNQGMATMLQNKWFHLFIFCDTIAMYSSIIVSVALIWAQLGDLNLVLTALRVALPLLGVSLSMMSLSFVAGVYLVVGKLRWLANSVLVTGFVLLTILATVFFLLCFPLSSNRLLFRYITHYPFCLLAFVSKKFN